MISIIIPQRDRESSRLKRCVKFIKNNSKGLVDEIIVVDYGSKSPIKADKGYKVIRVETDEWNKAHALNLGILAAKNDFVMTLDVDMLLSKNHFIEIEKNLASDNFIIDTNVRRIPKNLLRDDYEDMILNSNPWFQQSRNQLFNQANGGFQVYHKDFFNKIGGIMEGMGKFHRAVDNWVFYMARMNNMNVVDISYPLLHLEHDKQKEEHYDKEIRAQAEAYAVYKAWYLDYIINNKQTKNTDSFYGKQKPCEDLFKKFLGEVSTRDKKIQEAINSGKDQVTIAGQRIQIQMAKPSIIMCVINNSGLIPDFFVWDLINVFLYASKKYDVELAQINACSIEHMRNLAVKYALGQNPAKKRFDYVVMLDDDHRLNPTFVSDMLDKMIANNWPILTPLTPGKKKYPEEPKYRNTQYYKIMTPMDADGNQVECKQSKDEVIQIESSGPVGMIMKTSIFEKMPFPWYSMKYHKVTMEGVEQDAVLGSDLHFCELLKEAKIPIRCDLSFNLPHQKHGFITRGRFVPT